MSASQPLQLSLLLGPPYWCHDCAVSVPLAVVPAGEHSFYLGYICPHCLCAADILGVLATRELGQALLGLLDPSPHAITLARHER